MIRKTLTAAALVVTIAVPPAFAQDGAAAWAAKAEACLKAEGIHSDADGEPGCYIAVGPKFHCEMVARASVEPKLAKCQREASGAVPRPARFGARGGGERRDDRRDD